ncbi:MAG: hypothetical protein R3F20_19280 [Planctomycetota bacterium]
MARLSLLVPALVVLLAGASAAQIPAASQGAISVTYTPPLLGRTTTLTVAAPPLTDFIVVTDALPGAIGIPPYGTLFLGGSPALNVEFSSFAGPVGPIGIDGQAQFPFTIPANPALTGLVLFLQAFGTDAASPSGFSFSNAVSYVVAAPDSYVPTGNGMAEGRAFHRLAPLPDGGQLVVGGGDGQFLLPVASSTCERFDPYLRLFGPAPAMTHARTLHRVTALLDGRILVTGGSDTGGVGQGTAEIFDPVTQSWSAPIPMNAVRIGHTATLLADGRVLCSGGAASFVLNPPTSTNYLPIFQSAQNSAEIFDPATNQFTPLPAMSEKRMGHAATRLPSGKVLLTGGIRDGFLLFGTGAPLYALTSELFDPVTNAFTTAASPTISRVVHSQNVLPDGTVLMLGGAGGTLVVSVGSSEIYDETNDTWTPGPPLPAGQTLALHEVTPLPDGRLYVSGGAVGAVGSFSALPAAYLYDVAQGFTTLAPLDLPRLAHAAFLTREGVLLVGGADDGSPSVARSSAVHWAGP